MDPERAFLQAISADPDDLAPRLVYADWLEERNDPRGEFVRLLVRLAGSTADEPDYEKLKGREQELRPRFPAYWAALLDPPVWCLVGNVVDEHVSGPGGQETGHGIRLFRPNAKIYLADTQHSWAILEPAAMWGRGPGLQVVGQHRKSRQWIESWVRARYTTGWRLRLLRHPGAAVRLREAGWPAFKLTPDEFVCPEGRQDPETLRTFLEVVCAAQRRDWERRCRSRGPDDAGDGST